MVSSLRHSLPQLAPRYHFWLYTDAGSYVFCEITQRFRESSLSVFQKRADCLRIAIPTGQVSSLRCSSSVLEVILLVLYISQFLKNLCRATPCARNSTLLRVRRGKISLRQHRRKKHPALNPVYLRDTLRPLKSFSRSSSNFFCRHFFWLFFALPCRFACASGTRRQNCTRCTKEIRFPPGRSRPVFPAEDKSSVVLLPSTYLICQIKYFLDTFCENFLEIFFSIFAAQYIDFYRRYFFCILILITYFLIKKGEMYYGEYI